MVSKESRLQARVVPARKRLLERERDWCKSSLAAVVRYHCAKLLGGGESAESVMKAVIYDDLIAAATTLARHTSDEERVRSDLSVLYSDLRSKLRRVKREREQRRVLRQRASGQDRTRETSDRISLRVSERKKEALKMKATSKRVSLSEVVRQSVFKGLQRQDQLRRSAEKIEEWLRQFDDIRRQIHQENFQIRQEAKRLAKDIYETTTGELVGA